MILLLKKCLCLASPGFRTGTIRPFSGSASLGVGRHWREDNGLPPCNNEHGPLTDLPDWSYADGRPGSLNLSQRARRLRHMKNTVEAMKLLKAVEVAAQTYENSQNEQANERRRTLDTKLKPKNSSM